MLTDRRMVVLVLEHLDESLVALRRLMGWPMAEVFSPRPTTHPLPTPQQRSSGPPLRWPFSVDPSRWPLYGGPSRWP